MNTTKTRRTAVTLTERDEADLKKLKDSDTYREALNNLVGTSSRLTSEAQMLHALLQAGVQAVQQQVDEAGYTALAEEQRANRAQRQAVSRERRRRVPGSEES